MMKKGRNEKLVLIVPDTCPSALPTPTLAPATETSISPDMLESCLPECSPADKLHNTTLTGRDVLCGVTMNMNRTFNATAVNDSIAFWDENLNPMSDEDGGSQNYLTFCHYPEGDSFDGVASPFSAMKDSQMSSLDTFCRSSTENDWCSLSSGEMIVRNDGLCPGEQATMVVSSLDESIYATECNGGLSAESNLLSLTLPDVSENSSEGIVEDKGNPRLNMTFTPAWDCPTEGNDVALSSSTVALPTESEGGLLMTFTCEKSASCRPEEQLAGAEAELLPRTLSAVAQNQSKSVTIHSAVKKDNKSIYTSTPIQAIVDRRPHLRSFLESPLCGSAGSVRVQVRRKQNSVAPRECAVAGQKANKAKTVEMKKFPKSDYSKIKSKISTRVMYQVRAPGSALQRNASQAEVNNKHIEPQSGAENEMTPAKGGKGATAVASTEPQTIDFGVNTEAAKAGAPLKEPSALSEQVEGRGAQADHQPAADEHATAGQRSDATCDNQQTASQQAGSDTACFSTLEKSPDGRGQIEAAPKKVPSSKNEVRSGSALGPNRPSVAAMRPRCSSEGSSASQPPKEKKRALKISTSLIFPRRKTHQNQTKAGSVKCSSQRVLATPAEDEEASAENLPREVDRIGLVEEIGKSTSGPSGDDVKSRSRGKIACRPTRGTLPPQAPVTSPKLTPARLPLGALGKIECRIPKAGATLPLKPKSSTGSPKVQLSLGTRSSASSRPQLNGARRPPTPFRPSLIGPALTPSWRPPRKTPGPPTGLTEAREQGNSTSTQAVSRGAAPKPTPLKSILLKAKLFSTPAKSTKPALTSACTPAASTNKTASTSTPSLLKHSATARIVRPTLSALVDKSKSRTSSRQQPPPPPASKPSQSHRPPGAVPPASVAEDERKDHIIQQLTGHLAASNCRFEALAIVLQQSLAERDEATKQCRELSQELVSLQGELVSSVNSSERLEKEREGLRVTLEDALHRVQDQHQKDLAELEQRLQAFYQAEWNKMHVAYQEEADKCSTVMEQQMGELEAKHEAMKLQIESSHGEQLQSVKQQYEISLDELRQVHHQELQSLEENLKEAAASLSVRIQQLTEENNALLQKLTAEENRRKELAQKSQKDSHTLYLEQELESLKVVLDMKTTQLHQQEKKLMEINKLTEKNLKLDEILTKVQQENEDLKARMERHAALSRQLSTEQAVLQESLHKESKVNKRLSMENEELLWKLNNDLSSSRKASPTSASSPSHSFSFQSPRSSGLLSSPPVSPR